MSGRSLLTLILGFTALCGLVQPLQGAPPPRVEATADWEYAVIHMDPLNDTYGISSRHGRVMAHDFDQFLEQLAAARIVSADHPGEGRTVVSRLRSAVRAAGWTFVSVNMSGHGTSETCFLKRPLRRAPVQKPSHHPSRIIPDDCAEPQILELP